MIMLRSSERMGIAIDDQQITAALLRGNEIAWQSSIPQSSAQSIRDTVTSLLQNQKIRRVRKTGVTLMLGDSYARVREIRGIAPAVSLNDAADLVRVNQDRYFVAPFTESQTTSVCRSTDGNVIAAIANRDVIRDTLEACRQLGYQLDLVVVGRPRPDSGAVRNSKQLTAGAATSNAALAARYQSGEWLEIVPDEVVRARTTHRTTRLRFATAACAVAVLLAYLSPKFSDRWHRMEQSRRIATLERTKVPAQAQLDSLRRIAKDIGDVAETEDHSLRAIRQLSAMERLLPNGAILQQFRMDSASIEVAVLAREALPAVRAIAKEYPQTQMVGGITDEDSPGGRQRVLLRIPQKRSMPIEKARGNKAAMSGAKE